MSRPLVLAVLAGAALAAHGTEAHAQATPARLVARTTPPTAVRAGAAGRAADKLRGRRAARPVHLVAHE
jgi:hypothetical protein